MIIIFSFIFAILENLQSVKKRPQIFEDPSQEDSPYSLNSQFSQKSQNKAQMAKIKKEDIEKIMKKIHPSFTKSQTDNLAANSTDVKELSNIYSLFNDTNHNDINLSDTSKVEEYLSSKGFKGYFFEITQDMLPPGLNVSQLSYMDVQNLAKLFKKEFNKLRKKEKKDKIEKIQELPKKTCNKPFTKMDDSGQCVCETGYESTDPSEKGCWKCNHPCEENEKCDIDGECSCISGYARIEIKNNKKSFFSFINRKPNKDDLNTKDEEPTIKYGKCKKKLIDLIDVQPRNCSTPLCLLNVSVIFEQEIHKTLNRMNYEKISFQKEINKNILCRIGDYEGEAEKVGNGWILCRAPSRIPEKDVSIEVSIGGEVWSESSESLELVSSQPHFLPIGLIIAVLILGLFYNLILYRRRKQLDGINKSIQKIGAKKAPNTL